MRESILNILICIDDTDNLESPGTGKLAQTLADTIDDKGWGRCSRITRHQLFVHEKIPYTSHNSAMCFEVKDVADKVGRIDEIIALCQTSLCDGSAPGSDPGLCVAVNDEALNREKLIAFGQRAKESVLTKDMAYGLAQALGIHLSEHGGTGDGIIGAVAGIGLRLFGSDGRYRGWYHFGRTGESVQVETLLSHDFIDSVETKEGISLNGEDAVVLGGDQLKVVHRHQRQVVLVERCNGKTAHGVEMGNIATEHHCNRIDIQVSSKATQGDIVDWRTLSKEEVKIY